MDTDESFITPHTDPHLPAGLPREWGALFEELTGADASHSWGLRAAIAIARYRKAHQVGPTFSELFEDLLGLHEDALGATMTAPRQLRQTTYKFRHHVAVQWRRLGWINWDHNPRSLRTGRTFKAASRAWVTQRG